MKADLHIHTCLSPCGSLDMSPNRIIDKAEEKELSIIGICDHNSGENVLALTKVAKLRKSDIKIIPGMEVGTLEEAHVLAYFSTIDDLLNFQTVIYNHIMPGKNDEDLYGLQVIANENDEVEGMSEKLLIHATTMPIYSVIKKIHDFGGLAVAAHINRESFSVIGQLGFIPDDMEFDGLEVSSAITLSDATKEYSMYSSFPFITSSDAHYLDDIGKVYTEFEIEEPSFDEIKMALLGEGGRRVVYE